MQEVMGACAAFDGGSGGSTQKDFDIFGWLIYQNREDI
jgi:hypothetical protein